MYIDFLVWRRRGLWPILQPATRGWSRGLSCLRSLFTVGGLYDIRPGLGHHAALCCNDTGSLWSSSMIVAPALSWSLRMGQREGGGGGGSVPSLSRLHRYSGPRPSCSAESMRQELPVRGAASPLFSRLTVSTSSGEFPAGSSGNFRFCLLRFVKWGWRGIIHTDAILIQKESGYETLNSVFSVTGDGNEVWTAAVWAGIIKSH